LSVCTPRSIEACRITAHTFLNWALGGCVVRFTSLPLCFREKIYPVPITWEVCRVGGSSGLEVLQGRDTSLFYWDSNSVLSSP